MLTANGYPRTTGWHHQWSLASIVLQMASRYRLGRGINTLAQTENGPISVGPGSFHAAHADFALNSQCPTIMFCRPISNCATMCSTIGSSHVRKTKVLISTLVTNLYVACDPNRPQTNASMPRSMPVGAASSGSIVRRRRHALRNQQIHSSYALAASSGRRQNC